MGVTIVSQEFVTPIAPSRMFKALILDSHNLFPKLMPQSIKSIEFVNGDGGVGSIKQTNFTDGSHLKYLKHRIDAIDEEKLTCKYTLIEGDVLGDKLKFIAYESNYEASGDGGGSICKITSEYHSQDGVDLKEEEIKEGKDKASGMSKVIEAYLLQNPHLYA